jgi:hypothetical protein
MNGAQYSSATRPRQMEMTDFPDDELHTKPVAFMGAPYSHDLSSAKAAVLGVPFDCGVHPFRIGSRQGPMAIRAQSSLVRRYNPELADFDPLDRLGTRSHASKRQRSGFTMPA